MQGDFPAPGKLSATVTADSKHAPPPASRAHTTNALSQAYPTDALGSIAPIKAHPAHAPSATAPTTPTPDMRGVSITPPPYSTTTPTMRTYPGTHAGRHHSHQDGPSTRTRQG